MLRHTVLTRLAGSDCDVFTRARIAGRTSITIGQGYVHPQAAAVETAFAAFGETQSKSVNVRLLGAQATAENHQSSLTHAVSPAYYSGRMARNPDPENSSPAIGRMARRKRILMWAGGIVPLAAFLAAGAWLAHRQGAFSALWRKWQALQQSSAWDGVVACGFVALGLLGLVALWKGPQWQVAHVKGLEPKDRFDRENEARKTLATILGGIVLLTGGFFTWRNIKLAQDSQSISQRALSVAQEGQITDRFTKAIEQLGAIDATGKKKLEVRLGGIYALERIAVESERDHWPIVEVLCTYVRENAPRKPHPRGLLPGSPDYPHPEPDAQAVLTALGRRDRTHEPSDDRLNLAHTNLTQMRLRMADLSRAILVDADFTGALLYKANLSGALLNDADFTGANLTEANLSGANLTRATLNSARLLGANLRGANFSYATLDYALFKGSDPSEANFSDATLDQADLTGIDLREAKNLTQEQIEEASGDESTKLPTDLHMPKSWKK